MGKYLLDFVDLHREVAVQTNRFNQKQSVFIIDDSTRHSPFVKISKEFRSISAIAPEQIYGPYVLFIASTKKDKVLIMHDYTSHTIKNWQKKLEVSKQRSHEQTKLKFEQGFSRTKELKIYKYADGTVLFSHPCFGEVLYLNTYASLSDTYEYISDPDQYNSRLVCIIKDLSADARFAYINKAFSIIDEPFYKFIDDPEIAQLTNNLDLVCQRANDQFVYYFLNKEHLRCSHKYLNIQALDENILATCENQNQVFLNNLGKHITPEFAQFQQIGDSYVLQLNNDDNDYVIYSKRIEDQPLSVAFKNATLCGQKHLLLGDVLVDDKPKCILVNTANPHDGFDVDPFLAKLMMSYLNSQPLNPFIVDGLVYNESIFAKTLTAFNDCINQQQNTEQASQLNDSKNICNKFLNYLNTITLSKYKHDQLVESLSEQELQDMQAEYSNLLVKYGSSVEKIESNENINSNSQNTIEPKLAESQPTKSNYEDILNKFIPEIDQNFDADQLTILDSVQEYVSDSAQLSIFDDIIQSEPEC